MWEQKKGSEDRKPRILGKKQTTGYYVFPLKVFVNTYDGNSEQSFKILCIYEKPFPYRDPTGILGWGMVWYCEDFELSDLIYYHKKGTLMNYICDTAYLKFGEADKRIGDNAQAGETRTTSKKFVY
jgi:hypothetical protein